MKLIAWVLFVLSLLCYSDAIAVAGSDLDTEMKKAADQIKLVRGKGRCVQSKQCKVVGLGAELCGGYDGYFIYSTLDADEKQVLAWVARFNVRAEELHKTSLMVEHCAPKLRVAHCMKDLCRVVD